MRTWEHVLSASGWIGLAAAAGAALAAILLVWLARDLAARALRHRPLAADAVRATRLWLLAPLAACAGGLALELPARAQRVLEHTALALTILQLALWADTLVARWLALRARTAHGADAATALSLLGFVGRAAVWSLALLLGLSQLGFDVTALVAGLGIGGVAVALAVQNILGDLFASAAIVLDKPFVVGDYIVVGELSGTVENVGLKTTRVRSLSGEQLVFGNAQLLGAQIRNFQRLRERRIAFSIGVTYETPAAMLRAIPGWLKAAVEAQPDLRFDRAHFKEYADSSLNFEIVYYVLGADYNLYMDRQQAINLAIFEQFAAQGVEFAYPTTRMLYGKQGAPASS